MYLISLYFDKESNKRIEKYIKQVSKYTGNTFMLEHHVPSHMTLLSFQTDKEDKVLRILAKCSSYIIRDKIYFVSFGFFLPYVIYISPILNSYLSDMSCLLYDKLKYIESINFVDYYKPFNWFPHVTIGKTLNQIEMKKAFDVLQSEFTPFYAKIDRISLSKTNPYTDIISFSLKEGEK